MNDTASTPQTRQIRPLKDTARGPMAGLLSSFGAFVGAARGATDIAAPKALSESLPSSISVTEAPRENPLNDELMEVGGALQKLLTKYVGMDPAFIIPRQPNSGGGGPGGPSGPRSRLGKMVLPSSLASAKFAQVFGAEARKVVFEGENSLGEAIVKVEGLGEAEISLANVKLVHADGGASA